MNSDLFLVPETYLEVDNSQALVDHHPHPLARYLTEAWWLSAGVCVHRRDSFLRDEVVVGVEVVFGCVLKFFMLVLLLWRSETSPDFKPCESPVDFISWTTVRTKPYELHVCMGSSGNIWEQQRTTDVFAAAE